MLPIITLLWILGAIGTTYILDMLDDEPWDWSIFAVDLFIWPATLVILIRVYWRDNSKPVL